MRAGRFRRHGDRGAHRPLDNGPGEGGGGGDAGGGARGGEGAAGAPGLGARQPGRPGARREPAAPHHPGVDEAAGRRAAAASHRALQDLRRHPPQALEPGPQPRRPCRPGPRSGGDDEDPGPAGALDARALARRRAGQGGGPAPGAGAHLPRAWPRRSRGRRAAVPGRRPARLLAAPRSRRPAVRLHPPDVPGVPGRRGAGPEGATGHRRRGRRSGAARRRGAVARGGPVDRRLSGDRAAVGGAGERAGRGAAPEVPGAAWRGRRAGGPGGGRRRPRWGDRELPAEGRPGPARHDGGDGEGERAAPCRGRAGARGGR